MFLSDTGTVFQFDCLFLTSLPICSLGEDPYSTYDWLREGVAKTILSK